MISFSLLRNYSISLLSKSASRMSCRIFSTHFFCSSEIKLLHSFLTSCETARILFNGKAITAKSGEKQYFPL